MLYLFLFMIEIWLSNAFCSGPLLFHEKVGFIRTPFGISIPVVSPIPLMPFQALLSSIQPCFHTIYSPYASRHCHLWNGVFILASWRIGLGPSQRVLLGVHFLISLFSYSRLPLVSLVSNNSLRQCADRPLRLFKNFLHRVFPVAACNCNGSQRICTDGLLVHCRSFYLWTPKLVDRKGYFVPAD